MENEISNEEISFRYLAELRQWLYKNSDKEIIDINIRGEWDQMEFVVLYQRDG